MSYTPVWHGSMPPSYDGDRFVYLIAVFGLLSVFLLACEWAWRCAWALRERHEPLNHPATVARLTTLLLLVSVIMRVSGDVFLQLAWPELTPEARQQAAVVNNMVDGFSVVPFVCAWFMGVVGGAMIDWQLMRMPLPLNLWPTWGQLRRPVAIGSWVLVISLALTFMR